MLMFGNIATFYLKPLHFIINVCMSNNLWVSVWHSGPQIMGQMHNKKAVLSQGQPRKGAHILYISRN